jgi:[NiFe] hydrogenase assembly HybE family chaperone
MNEVEAAAAREVGDLVADWYRAVHERSMRGLPICNAALDVEATGFRAHEGHAVGVVTTPWFMNIVVVPLRPEGPILLGMPGRPVALPVPAGLVDMTVADLDGFGHVGVCALFSPMDEFTPETAAAAARAALEALFDPALLDPVPASPRQMDRRALLRGRLGKAEGASP